MVEERTKKGIQVSKENRENEELKVKEGKRTVGNTVGESKDKRRGEEGFDL